jgi:hypothetical protein
MFITPRRGEIDDNPSIKRPIDPKHVQNLAIDIQVNQLHEYPVVRRRGNPKKSLGLN